MIKFIRRLAPFSKYYALCDIDTEDCEYAPIPESSIIPILNPSTEQLMQIISEHADPSRLNEIYNLHKKHYQSEHALLTLRIMTHFLGDVQASMDQLNFKDNCIQLSTLISQNLEGLNSVDLTEILFFKSRYNQRGLGELLQPLDQFKISQLIKSQIQNGAEFTLRQLVNMWFDSQNVGLNPLILKEQILKRIGQEQMTCAEVLLLIRCELIRLQKKRKVDLDLVNMCLKNVEDNFFFYDYSQLTHVYNYVLKMKLQYFTPNLCTPAIVKKIRTYLQSQLRKIDEYTLTAVLTCYELLPKDIDSGLEIQIKEFLLKTIKTSPSRITTKLLYCFKQNCSSLCTEEELSILNQQLTSQLTSDILSVETANSISHMIQTDQFRDYVQQVCQKHFTLQGLKYLKFICKDNIDNLILKYRNKIDIYTQYQMLSNKESIKEEVMSKIRNDPITSISQISRLYPINEELFEILEFAYDQYLSGNSHQENHQSIIIRGILNKRIMEKCTFWINQRRNDIYKVMFRNMTFNQYQCELLGPLLLSNIERISISALIGIMFNTNLVIQLGRNNIKNLTYFSQIMKRYQNGQGLLVFCRYLSDNGIDYSKCLIKSSRNLDLQDSLYEKSDPELKLIILYILFFN